MDFNVAWSLTKLQAEPRKRRYRGTRRNQLFCFLLVLCILYVSWSYLLLPPMFPRHPSSPTHPLCPPLCFSRPIHGIKMSQTRGLLQKCDQLITGYTLRENPVPSQQLTMMSQLKVCTQLPLPCWDLVWLGLHRSCAGWPKHGELICIAVLDGTVLKQTFVH